MIDSLGAPDEVHNNMVAAGAILLALQLGQRNAEALTAVAPVVDRDGHVTNQIDVKLSFLKSPYRITIERVPDVAETMEP